MAYTDYDPVDVGNKAIPRHWPDKFRKVIGGLTVSAITFIPAACASGSPEVTQHPPISVDEVDHEQDPGQTPPSTGDTDTNDGNIIVDPDTMEIVAPDSIQRLLNMSLDEFRHLPDNQRVELATYLYANPFHISRETFELTAGWTPDAEIDNQHNPLVNPGTWDDNPQKILDQINFAAKAATAQINQGSAQLDVNRAVKIALFEYYEANRQLDLMKDEDGRAVLANWLDELEGYEGSNLVPLARDYVLDEENPDSIGELEEITWLGETIQARTLLIVSDFTENRYKITVTLAEDELPDGSTFSRWTVAGVTSAG